MLQKFIRAALHCIYMKSKEASTFALVVFFSNLYTLKNFLLLFSTVSQQHGQKNQSLKRSNSPYVNSNVLHSKKVSSTPYINMNEAKVNVVEICKH